MLRKIYKTSVLCIGFLSLFTIGCAGDSVGSMVGDSREVDSCPTGGCADVTPKLNKTYIGISEGNLIVDTAQDRVDISGQCGISTFSNHQITLTIKDSAGQGRSCSYIPITSTQDNKLICKDGRFHAVVNAGSCLTSGANYNLEANLLVWNQGDSQAQQNTATGKYVVPVRKN